MQFAILCVMGITLKKKIPRLTCWDKKKIMSLGYVASQDHRMSATEPRFTQIFGTLCEQCWKYLLAVPSPLQKTIFDWFVGLSNKLHGWMNESTLPALKSISLSFMATQSDSEDSISSDFSSCFVVGPTYFHQCFKFFFFKKEKLNIEIAKHVLRVT